jgi:glyoxylase-like metal-dependent hydrolase (beta-lactamase superfamily II)
LPHIQKIFDYVFVPFLLCDNHFAKVQNLICIFASQKTNEEMAGISFQLINTGFFYADGGSMFGATPRTAWGRRYPCDDRGCCLLAMRVGLVRTEGGRVILIDTGVGNKQLDRLRHTSYRFFDLVDLCDALRERGLMPRQVTDIVLTHLHFDHCGDATRYDASGALVPTFPSATCWVSQAQWENALHPDPLEADSIFPENMEAIHQSGRLRLVHTACDLCDGVQLCLYDGHTQGQLAPYIQTGESTVVFAGDVIPIAAQVSPKWISAYDLYPQTSYHEKIRMLDQAAAHDQLIVHYHDAYTPCTTVKKIGHFFKTNRKVTL